jgi:hypothetical protein
MNRNRFLAAVLACAMGFVAILPLRADETEAERLARLKAMSAAEKEVLAQKKARYDSLPPEEKERLKKLCDEINSRPDAPELSSVMARYHQWLKTLSASQLAELRDLPEKERLDRIKKLLHDQQRKSFLQIARQASPEDLETVFEWNKAFVVKNRDRILKTLPGDFGRRIAENPDENRQTLILMYLMLSRRMGSDMPRPGKEEVEELLPKLSPASQKLFNDTPNFFTRVELISIWSWGALWSKAFPNVTSEQLASVFSKLPPTERDRLERLPTKERETELRYTYARMNFFRRSEWGDRSPWEGRGGRDREGPGFKDGPSRRSGDRPTRGKKVPPPSDEKSLESTIETQRHGDEGGSQK